MIPSQLNKVWRHAKAKGTSKNPTSKVSGTYSVTNDRN
jgi:hypothetical protein